MKKIVFLISFLLLSTAYTQAQCNLVYVGPANGNWHTASNWNLCKVPGANDIVTIPTGRSVRINNANATCRRITVQGTGTVTRNGSGTLTVTNSTGAVACTAACSKTVFLLRSQNGNLGGLAGADSKCQAAANSAGLSGTYKAWLSNSTTDAAARLTHSTSDYVLVNGAVVANGWSDLVDGSLDNPINIDASGGGPYTAGVNLAYTYTNSSGLREGNNNHCNNWTSTSGFNGVTGNAEQTNGQWSRVSAGSTCNPSATNIGIYCFEQ